MARFKFLYVFQVLLTFCLCEIDIQKKIKLVNGFVDFYNSLPNKFYTCDEGFLQSAQLTDISNAYDISVSLRVSETRDVDVTKYLRCTATVADVDLIGVAVMKHHCEYDPSPGENPANIEEPVTETNVVTETPFVRKPIQLDNEVQTDTAVTSGEQFIAIPREEPKVHCIGCSSHVNTQAEGVIELADIGVRQLNALEPTVKHTLTSVVDVERQVQIVNGVRFTLTLIIDYNNCSIAETDPCSTSKACKITILEKPWMQLPDGSKYRAILSNNCTEEWRFGDDGVVVPLSDNKENNNIDPTNTGSDPGLIKPIHTADIQTQHKTQKTLTDQDIKNLEEQIIPHNEFITEPTSSTTESSSTTAETVDTSKEHVVKLDKENQFSPNSIHTGKPQKVEHLNDDKKKAIDDLINFFNFAGYDSNINDEQTASRMKRSFDEDLRIMNLAEKFEKVKKNIEVSKQMYKLGQFVVNYLNEMDLKDKDRVLKAVISAEEESEGINKFYYIQFHTVLPCKLSFCEAKDIVPKICNAVIDNSEKNPQILTVFCHDEDKNKNIGKMNSVPLDDPILLRLIDDSIKKMESESNITKARKLNRVIDASTQRLSGTLTKFSILLDQTDCDRSVPFMLRSNCTVLEENGSQLCDVTIHERHWLKERSIYYVCTDRPIDIRFSAISENEETRSPNDPEVLDMVQEALRILEDQSVKNNKQLVVKINSVSSQIVAGFLTTIEFVVGFTSCPSHVQSDEIGKCKLLDNESFRTCVALVWDRTWIEDERKFEVSCKEPTTESNNVGKRMKRSTTTIVGGPTEQDPNTPKYRILAEKSLEKYLQNTGNSQAHKILSIDTVSTQVVAGTKTEIYFKITPTAQNSDDVISCRSSVWERSWLNKTEIDVNCEIDRNERVKRGIPGGVEQQDPNDPKYKILAEKSLEKYLQNTGNSQAHKILSIDTVSTQVVAGTKTEIYFKITPTAQNSDDVISCRSSVWERSWLNKTEIDVNCEIDRNERVKRGIPGGVEQQDPNDPKYKILAEKSLEKYLQNTGNSQAHKILSIDTVSTQVVAGTKTEIYFKITPTAQNSDDVISCRSSVWERSWLNKTEIDVNCEIDRNERVKRGIPGGVEQQDPNDPKYKILAEKSLEKYLQNTGNSQAHKILSIDTVSTQVVAGTKTEIYFKITPTAQNSDDVISCRSSVWERSWLNKTEIDVNCEIDRNERVKRGIPGGVEQQDPNDPKYKILAEKSLEKYLQNTGNSQAHKILSIDTVSTQVVAGTKTEIYFKITPTAQNSDDVISCRSSVWERSWLNKTEINVDCKIDDKDKRAKRHIITGGFVEQDPNNPKYRKLAMISLRKYLKDTGNTVPHKIINIEKARTQIVSGLETKIEFNIAPEASVSGDIIRCESDIWEKSWQNQIEITVSCELYNSIARYKREDRNEKRSEKKGGKRDEDPSKEEYRKLAQESLQKYQKQKNNAKGYTIANVNKVTKKVVSGIIYELDFTAALKSCAHDLSLCNTGHSSIHCLSIVLLRPWPQEKDIKVSCKSEQKRHKRRVNLIDAEKSNKINQPTEIEFVEIEEREKREAIDDDYLDEDIKFYYADRAIQQLNIQLRSSNLHKLITIYGVQTTTHMDNTQMVRMYIETAETYCLRHYEDVKLADCEELDGNNHRLCLARIWPSPDDAMVLQQVFIVCDNNDKFESITGLSIPTLLKTSIKTLERSPELKYKLVHQGEPQLIPSLDSKIPMKLNFIIRSTNCSKHVNNVNKYNCFIDGTKPSKACTSLIWLIPNSRSIKKLTTTCSKTDFRQKRSVSMNANASSDDLKIQKLVKESLEKIEMSSPQRYKQKVLNINNYSTKVTSGKVTTIDFDVGFTSCLKYEWVSDVESCDLMEHLPRRHCVAEVWERLWLDNWRNIDVKCEDEEVPLEAHVEFQNADTALALANRAIAYIEAKYPHPRKQKVVRIFSLDKQVVAGVHYRLKIEVGVTNCSALSSDTYCVIDKKGGAENKFCRVNVWLRPWTDHPPNFRVTCDYHESAMSDLYHEIQAEHLFRDFLTTHRPEYVDDHDELMHRFEVFKNNVKRIHELNIHERGSATYGVTRFADLTYDEFTKRHMGLKPSLRDDNQLPMREAKIPNVEVPASFDWREHGAVTEVKDQGSCGSCWAFSVTGNIEGQWKIKSGKLVSLSEQELVDCDKMDDGCNGGLPDNAYRAIEQLGGLETEKDYPYEGENDKCSYNKSLSSVQISGAVNITTNETDMAKWLIANGPISIGINANAMQFYMGGVSHPWKMLCSPKNLDHGVLIVGYGIKNYPLFHKSLPYWIVKNSWGPSWGEQGYYRVFRGDGTCGLNQMASSAVI